MPAVRVTPEIRFKEFNDSWIDKTLRNYFAERVESMPNGELISVTINDGIKKFSELGRHDNSNEDKSKYKKICVGDIAYNSMRMWQGASGYSYYEGIVSPAYTVLCAEKNTDAKFFSYMFKRASMLHVFQNSSQGITSDNWNLKYPAFSQIPVYAPTIEEQKAIGIFLNNLDTSINLHQRKCDALKEIKKTLLAKMFPAKGETVPEIRFKGFTDDWEQRQLGGLLSLLKDGTHGTHRDYKSGPLLLSAKNIKDGKLIISDEERHISNSDYNRIFSNYALHEGDILLTIVGTLGEVALFPCVEEVAFQRSVAFLRCKSEINNLFLKALITGETFQYELDQRKSVSAQPGIYLSELSNMSINITESINEQIKIGILFSKVDNLITLHQRKCDMLKEMKQTLLSKLFV